MKRLMLMFAAAVAVAFSAQTAFAQTASNARPDKRNTNGYGLPSTPQAATHHPDYPAGPGQNPKEYPESTLANTQPFMPKDTKIGVGWMIGKACDQNGNFVEQGSSRCRILVSHSTGKTYIFRPSEQEGNRIFVRNGNTAELYVHFNGGRYANTVAFQSPAAQQFASANGYQLNQQDKTMVAANGPAPTEKRTVNCKAGSKSLPDIIGCANGTVNATTVASAKPATQEPVVAQAPTCSTGTFMERKQCQLQAALKGVTPTTATTLP